MIKELLIGEWGSWNNGEFHTLRFTNDNFSFYNGNITCGNKTFRVKLTDGCLRALGQIFCRTSARNVTKLPQNQV